MHFYSLIITQVFLKKLQLTSYEKDDIWILLSRCWVLTTCFKLSHQLIKAFRDLASFRVNIFWLITNHYLFRINPNHYTIPWSFGMIWITAANIIVFIPTTTINQRCIYPITIIIITTKNHDDCDHHSLLAASSPSSPTRELPWERSSLPRLKWWLAWWSWSWWNWRLTSWHHDIRHLERLVVWVWWLDGFGLGLVDERFFTHRCFPDQAWKGFLHIY